MALMGRRKKKEEEERALRQPCPFLAQYLFSKAPGRHMVIDNLMNPSAEGSQMVRSTELPRQPTYEGKPSN
jgi:hypothetical protein